MSDLKDQPTAEDWKIIDGELSEDSNSINIDPNIFINIYHKKEILTKKEIITQMTAWLGALYLNEHE